MNGKMLAAVIVGMVLGVMAASVRWSTRAEGQGTTVRGPKLPQWEYKVVYSGTSALDAQNAEALTKQFGKLATDGWEYVGPIVDRTFANRNGYYAGNAGVLVLFKRAKP